MCFYAITLLPTISQDLANLATVSLFCEISYLHNRMLIYLESVVQFAVLFAHAIRYVCVSFHIS